MFGGIALCISILVAYMPVLPPVTRYTLPVRSGMDSNEKLEEGMMGVFGDGAGMTEKAGVQNIEFTRHGIRRRRLLFIF